MAGRRFLAGLLTALWCLAAGAGLAQTEADGGIAYDTWETVATRAEETLSSEDATELQLDLLRARLVNWRTGFLAAQSAAEPRIATVREQIAALGEAPAEGETEAEDIATRRAELNERLAELRAPGLEAELAYNRADGLISELDALTRARTARELTELGPSPLNPAHWTSALNELVALGSALTTEAQESFEARREVAGAELLRAAFFFLVAAALVLRGRAWVSRAIAALGRRLEGAKRGVGSFLVSLGQVAVPILGIYAAMRGIDSLGLLGLRGEVLVNTLPIIGLAGFGGAWLGQRLFPSDPEDAVALNLSDLARAEGRFHAAVLGLLLGLDTLAMRTAEMAGFSPAARAVLAFPILVLAALVLGRLGLILMQPRHRSDSGETPRFTMILAGVLGRMALVLALLGLGAAAIGFLNAARGVLFPTALSLALIGLLTVLFFLIRDAYGFLRGQSRDQADQSLVPVLLSFLLTVASLPLFALIWGARMTEIGEVLRRIGEGIAIGESRVSPVDFLTFLLVFAVIFGLTRVFQAMLRATVLPKTRLDTGGQNAITSGVGYVGVFLAALIGITSAGIDLSSLALVAGALSVGIGFGLQNVVSNFVSGIILLIERPVGEGDWIEVGGQMGIVKAISVRSTRIETFDRTDVIVPNADLVSGTVTNWTKGNLMGRVKITVGVAYACDSRQVERILLEICEAHPMVAVDPPPKVYFLAFGADALEFTCYCILRDVNYKMVVNSELNHQVHERFRAEGIEIPFAQRDLWLRNPEALRAPPVPPPGTAPDRAAPAPSPDPLTAPLTGTPDSIDD